MGSKLKDPINPFSRSLVKLPSDTCSYLANVKQSVVKLPTMYHPTHQDGRGRGSWELGQVTAAAGHFVTCEESG